MNVVFSFFSASGFIRLAIVMTLSSTGMGSRPGLGAGGRYSGSLRSLDIVLLTAKLLMKLLQPEVVGCSSGCIVFI